MLLLGVGTHLQDRAGLGASGSMGLPQGGGVATPVW